MSQLATRRSNPATSGRPNPAILAQRQLAEPEMAVGSDNVVVRPPHDWNQEQVARQRAEKLILDHKNIVKRVAWEVYRKTCTSMSIEDLVQCGMLALVAASRSVHLYDLCATRAYVNMRVRGAMLDQLRKETFQPRSAFRKARAINEARRTVEGEQGRAATNDELAVAMKVTPSELQATLDTAQSFQFSSIDDQQSRHSDDLVDGGPDSLEVTLDKQKWHDIRNAIAALPERQQIAMKFFTEEWSLQKIGKVLGVTEPRACQIKSAALASLRQALEGWDDK